MKNIEPAVMTLSLDLGNAGGIASGAFQQYNFDLSHIASLVNRRFYRQGLNWGVAGIKVISSGATPGVAPKGRLICKKLPNTWVFANAWRKGFAMWSRMNKEALEESESIRPRFLDFKVFADQAHHVSGSDANVLPLNYDAGEWTMSQYVIPDTSVPGTSNTFQVIGVGANYQGAGAEGFEAVSLIEGYAASRALPEQKDPNVPDDSSRVEGPTPQNYFAALFNEGTDQSDDIIEDLITQNNTAPYPFENGPIVNGGGFTYGDTMYPNGENQNPDLQIHDVEIISGTTIGGTTRLKGGNFPCGLMRLLAQNDGEEDLFLTVQIDLIPGPHRGYLAESMMEM